MTRNIIILIGLVLAVAIGILLFSKPRSTFGSATSGNSATIATTSAITLPALSAASLAATSTCTSRIISTTGSAIMLTFSDKQGTIPTGQLGMVQPASTTVAYDSGLYGCGLVRAYSFTAQSLTISETQ